MSVADVFICPSFACGGHEDEPSFPLMCHLSAKRLAMLS